MNWSAPTPARSCPPLAQEWAGRVCESVLGGGADTPGARTLEEGETMRTDPCSGLLPLPFTPSATALVSADGDTQGWGARAPGSPPLMTGAPVMTSPAPSLTPW